MKRKTPLKKKSTTSITKLKDQLWKLCRQIIIKRYGNTCYCCNAANLTGANLHIGHFIPSSVSSTELRYDLDNLRPSCYRCNIHLSGNWPAYEQHLNADGISVTGLKRRNRETTGMKYDSLWYKAKIKEYEAVIADFAI